MEQSSAGCEAPREGLEGMPTYQITCAECGEDRWPVQGVYEVLQLRHARAPARYVCARCISASGAKRRKAGLRVAQTKKARQQPRGGAE